MTSMPIESRSARGAGRFRWQPRTVLIVVLAVVSAVTLDIVAGPEPTVIGLLAVTPLLASFWLEPRVTAVVGAGAVAGAIGLGVPNGILGSPEHLTRVLTVLAGAGIGVGAARMRVDRERALLLLAVQGSVSLVLNEAQRLPEAAPRILRIIGEALDCEVGALWQVDDAGQELVRTERWSAPGVSAAEIEVAGDETAFAPGVGLPGRVWASGRPAAIEDLARDPNFPRRRPAVESGLETGFAFPVQSGEATVGVIEFFARSGGPIRARDLEMLDVLGRQIGLFMERTRANDERSYIARTLQASLLPPALPQVPGLEIAARHHAVGEENEVGGDFYDLFQTASRRWSAVMGDVQGKGTDAAAMIGLARHTLRAAAMTDANPRRILGTLHEAVYREGDEESFCTAALVSLELGDAGIDGEVTSAGHPLPLLLRADGSVEAVGAPGTLVGAVAELDLNPRGFTLEPGDALVMFTDGIFEAGSGTDRFGHGRLEALLRGCCGAPASALAARIEHDVLEFQDGEPADDMAVLVLRRCRQGEPVAAAGAERGAVGASS